MGGHGDVERGNAPGGPGRSFSPVKHFIWMAFHIRSLTRVFDLGISTVFRFSLYIYWFVAGRYPTFIEEDIRRQILNEAAKYESENVKRLEKENKTLAIEKDDALRRLSEVVSVRLRDNNPNIADLNDQCRPTKLAEMFSELYDNEWTCAYATIEKELDETKTIRLLLNIMMQAYGFCEETVADPWNVVTKWFLDMNLPGAQQTSKWLKDSRKANIRNKLHEVRDDFKKEVFKTFKENKIIDLLEKDEVDKYLEKCVEVSLLMVTTDPPVVVLCPELEENDRDISHIEECQPFMGKAIDSSSDEKDRDDKEENNTETIAPIEHQKKKTDFDKNLFKEYTFRGNYFDFIVWPALLLHKDGPLLSKGIAQGMNNIKICQTDESKVEAK
ncbi:uncharacterized protein LOC132739389 isoform X2 [Ruditapes philippinarum]|uniref:uncharacterized protein LOC132739389 isoform X2 n=1 Tax=Ruditapes philippinarum TaxID=129788 RepID=UPI00295C30FD|nr:uncharacterized protein LOC132739389 isoform X2 [Ruditapes philippinarum]